MSIEESSESNSATTTTTTAAAAFVDKVEEKEKTKLVLEPETKLDHMEPTSLVQLLLLRHPQEKKLERLEKELLTISGKASMRVLKTFLSRKLSYNAQGKDGITVRYVTLRWHAYAIVLTRKKARCCVFSDI